MSALAQDAQPTASACMQAELEQHFPQVLRYFASRLRCAQDAMDLAQDACVEFLSRNPSIQVRNSLSYLYGICARVLADFRRRAVTEAAVLVIDSEVAEHRDALGFTAVGAGLVERLEAQQQVIRALNALPALQAKVMIALERDELSYADAARTLGLSPHTVHKYRARARAQLSRLTFDAERSTALLPDAKHSIASEHPRAGGKRARAGAQSRREHIRALEEQIACLKAQLAQARSLKA